MVNVNAGTQVARSSIWRKPSAAARPPQAKNKIGVPIFLGVSAHE